MVYWELESKISSLKNTIRHRQKISEAYYKHLRSLGVLPSDLVKDIFKNSFFI